MWHFGDSFTTPNNKKGWGFELSNKLNRKFVHRGQSGASNFQILLNLINELPNINSSDVILINWSFLTRGILFTKNGMISTNRFYFDEGKSFNTSENLETHEIELKNEYLSSITYLLENSIQENSIVFTLSNSIQKYLEQKDIRMISVFLEKDWLTINGKKEKWPNNNFNLYNLKFEPDYFRWLEKNNYLGDSELDTHYKDGISDIIANEYFNKITQDII